MYVVEWFDRKADKWGRREFKTEKRALDHGCVDAYCARCDNPNPEK